MINFWKLAYETVKEQRDQRKTELDILTDDLSWYKAKVNRLERENERLKEAKQEKEQLEEAFQYQLEKRLEYFNKYQELKQENAQLKEKNGELQEVIEGKNNDLLFTEDENEQLKQDLLRTEELQDEIIQLEKDFEIKNNLLSEISQHIGNKLSSSTHKYFRAKLDGIGIKEGE